MKTAGYIKDFRNYSRLEGYTSKVGKGETNMETTGYIKDFKNYSRLESYTGKVGNGGYPNSWIAGTIGESAYEIAVKHGFEGTEEEWLDSLSPYIGENGNWFIGNEDTGVSASQSIDMIALTEEEILEICK